MRRVNEGMKLRWYDDTTIRRYEYYDMGLGQKKA